MKKTTIIIVLALLCLNFWASAQGNKAVDVTTKGVQVGQQVPEFTITNLHNYKDASGKSANTAKLSDFKGKLLIIDFWATWCTPCVAMIPKMDNLQRKFKDKVQFISVTNESPELVLPFLTKWEKQNGLHSILPVATSDISLSKIFPHVYLPHYIWIDGNGVVRAITSLREVNELEISKAIAQNYASLPKKQDFKITWDKDKPLFINGNGGDGSTMTYRSLLSPYITGIPAGFTITPPLEGKEGFSKMLARNVPLAWMFRIALQEVHKKQFTDAKCIFESKDSLNMIPSLMWSRRQELSLTYELLLPAALQARGSQFMLDDLVKLFPQYSVTVEKRKKVCYALRMLPNAKISSSAGGQEKIDREPNLLRMRNGSLQFLINTLDFFYFSQAKIPIVNLVDDKTLTDLVIHAPLSNPEAINLELTKYGLELVKGEFEIDMIVYRDRDTVK